MVAGDPRRGRIVGRVATVACCAMVVGWPALDANADDPWRLAIVVSVMLALAAGALAALTNAAARRGRDPFGAGLVAVAIGAPTLVLGLFVTWLFVSGWSSEVVVERLAGPVALVVVVGVGALAWRRYLRDRATTDRRGSDRHRILHVLDAPGVTVEIDARWPGRTRLRVPAPDLLPLQGPARLVPRSVRRGGRELSRAFGDLVWTGRGAADVAGWAAPLEAPLRALWGWRDRYTLQATLTPFGLIVHMPLAAATPNEEPFLVEQARALARGLGSLATAALPAGVRFELPTIADADCPTCWERVGARAVVCAACGARQHPDCARWTGGCGRFGCAGERAGGLPVLTG